MKQIAEHTTTAAVAGTASFATGMATVMEWIPENIGWIASLLGCFLTAVLIFVQLRKACLDGQKKRVEIAILELKRDAITKGIKLRRQDNGISEEEI